LRPTSPGPSKMRYSCIVVAHKKVFPANRNNANEMCLKRCARTTLFIVKHTHTHARQERQTEGMDTLPPELVCLIIKRTGTLMLPPLRYVSTHWRALIDHLRESIPLRPCPRVRIERNIAGDTRRISHQCTLPSNCAAHYVQCLIERAWWRLFDWAIDNMNKALDYRMPFAAVRCLDIAACARAAADGDLEMLEAFHKRGFTVDVGAWHGAAERGHVHILRWLQVFAPVKHCPSAFRCAAKGGHLYVIEWLARNGIECDSTIYESAAKHGHMHIIRWARARGLRPCSRMCASAAAGGHLDIIQWAAGKLVCCGVRTYEQAAYGGHLAVMQWIFQTTSTLDPSNKACLLAARHGHLHVLEWQKSTSQELSAYITVEAAKGGHTNVMRWAKTRERAWGEHECIWNESVCAEAAHGGHLDALQWARANGCPWDAMTCTDAAIRGHLHVVQWAVANGCPYDAAGVAEAAARYGYVAVLQWLHAIHGVLCKANVCHQAAAGGQLSSLKWARSVGYSWDDLVCARAASAGSYKVFVWAVTHGCPWDEKECICKARGNAEIVQWIRNR